MPTNLRRYYGAGYLHFFTASCYQRRAQLGTPQNRDLFLKVMERVRRRYAFVVVGYVVTTASPRRTESGGGRVAHL
jgi:putative transposase